MPQREYKARRAATESPRLGATLSVVAGQPSLAPWPSPRHPSESHFKLTFGKPATNGPRHCPWATGVSVPWYLAVEHKTSACRSTKALFGAVVHTTTPTQQAYQQLDEIRGCYLSGKVAGRAERLSSQSLMGEPKLLMPYQPFCDVRLHFPRSRQVTRILRRELHPDAIALAVTTYRGWFRELPP